MVSVASGGTADRIAARILFKVLQAGSGTPERYSSTFFGARLAFAVERRMPVFAFFISAMLQRTSSSSPCPEPRDRQGPNQFTSYRNFYRELQAQQHCSKWFFS